MQEIEINKGFLQCEACGLWYPEDHYRWSKGELIPIEQCPDGLYRVRCVCKHCCGNPEVIAGIIGTVKDGDKNG